MPSWNQRFNGMSPESFSPISRRRFLQASALVVGAGALTTATGCSLAINRSEASALEALAKSMTGDLLLPTAPDFQGENLPANDVYESVLPIAIAMCASPADVQKCIQWCIAEGIRPVIRGGGHNYIGASTTTGLLIKTTRMNQVEVDPATGIMTIGGGTLNRDLLATLRGGDWMLPIGTCPGVGVAGLVLGGGIGDNARWAGMTCDHLVSTDIVLASGELVTADQASNPDLFWALRGGAGGNFGANTSFTFQLIRIPRPKISVFGFRFSGDQEIVAAWSAFDRLMIDAPPELSGFTGITNVQPLGGDASPAPGRADPYPQFTIDGCFQGSAAVLREILAPVFDAATPADYLLGEFDYWDAQINWLAVPPMIKHGLAESARYTNAPIPTEVLSELVARVGAAPGGSEEANAEVRLMCWSGGKVNEVAPDATAYVHRESHNLVRPAIWWADQPDSMVRDLQDWQKETSLYVSQHAERGSFVNWPYAELDDWARAYYGSNLERLVSVKAAVDPGNTFTYAQSIPTSLT